MVIEKLKLVGFRGATKPVEIAFAPGSMVVLYGENGAGKSTIIDALDFVCNHLYGSLSERAGSQPRKYLAAIGTNPDDLRVHIWGGGQEWIGRLTEAGSIIVDPTGPPSAMILRRSRVLQVLNAPPHERYQTIRSYVELPGIFRSEETLRAAVRQAQKDFDAAALAKGQSDETLRTLWSVVGQPGQDWDTWAVEQAAVDADALRKNVESSRDTLMAIMTRDDFQSEEDASPRELPSREGLRLLEQKLVDAQVALSQFQIILPLVETWQSQTADAERLEATTRRLQAMLAIIEVERKDYVDNLLQAISADVERMYAQMHPGEDIGQVRFSLDSRYASSLIFDGQFGTETAIPPQAYYSEAHLDTLGVCVFLALAQSQHSRAKVVVLDDVLTSVDSSHLTRFLNMLEGETFPQQLIITTYYRRWLSRYKQMGNPKVSVIELLSWNLERGIRPAKALLDVDSLKTKIKAEPLDRQGVASAAGVLLEALLDQLTILYGCSMPRNPYNIYTLQPLCDGVTKTAKTLEVSRPASGERIAFYPLLDAVKQLVHVRNLVGAHDNPAESDILDNEVRAFGQAAVALAETLLRPECSLLPYKDKGAALHCGCGVTHLTPPPTN